MDMLGWEQTGVLIGCVTGVLLWAASLPIQARVQSRRLETAIQEARGHKPWGMTESQFDKIAKEYNASPELMLSLEHSSNAIVERWYDESQQRWRSRVLRDRHGRLA